MSFQYDISGQEPSLSEEDESQCWAEQLARYLRPYQERLDAYVDRRVVGNLMATVGAIVQSRWALTTSELGSAICGPAHAEAGTQRLQYALHHQGWEAEVIEEVLWQEAEQRRQHYNQPSRIPVSVRGYEWESLLLVGANGIPQVVAMRWWQRQKGVPGQQRQQQESLLSQVAQRWGRQVRHIFDRGYGHGPWLWGLGRYRLRFEVRWKKGNKLIDAEGRERKAWEIARGKRPWGEARQLWDTHCRVYRSTRVLAFPVRHPEYQGPLWLVVVRQGRGREPWYLLTNEPVETIAQAWEMVFSYVSRWKIEESFRFQKCELLIDSLRLRSWQAQRKLLLLVTLAYGSLLAMLGPPLRLACCCLLEHWCQRADWRLWQVKVPLYRLRWSLGRLWQAHPPRWVGWRPYRPPTHITWPVCSVPWWMALWHLCGYPF